MARRRVFRGNRSKHFCQYMRVHSRNTGMPIEIGINLLWNSHNCFDSPRISREFPELVEKKPPHLEYARQFSLFVRLEDALLQVWKERKCISFMRKFIFEYLTWKATKGTKNIQKLVWSCCQILPHQFLNEQYILWCAKCLICIYVVKHCALM